MLKYISGVGNAPPAIGPYSQAVIYNNMAYLSGQIPLHPETGEIVEGGIEAQTNQVMKNLFAVLDHMGVDFAHVVKSTIFLTDLGNFKAVNKIYGDWLGDVKPARATVEVSALPMGAAVEIEMIAAVVSRDTLMTFEGGTSELDDVGGQSYSMTGKE